MNQRLDRGIRTGGIVAVLGAACAGLGATPPPVLPVEALQAHMAETSRRAPAESTSSTSTSPGSPGLAPHRWAGTARRDRTWQPRSAVSLSAC